MTCHYPDLGSASDWLKQISLAARLIRSITQIWVVTTRHLCGISADSPQMPFNWSRREISAYFLRLGVSEIINTSYLFFPIRTRACDGSGKT